MLICVDECSMKLEVNFYFLVVIIGCKENFKNIKCKIGFIC